MISGSVPPSLESPIKVTVGFAVQLSASSVTTVMSVAGTSEVQKTVTGEGLLAVGATLSTVIVVTPVRLRTGSPVLRHERIKKNIDNENVNLRSTC